MKFDYQTHTQIIDSSWNSIIKYTHRSLTVHEIRWSNTFTNPWQFMKFDYQIHTQIIDSSWNSIIKYTHRSLTVHEIWWLNTYTNHWQLMKFDHQIHTQIIDSSWNSMIFLNFETSLLIAPVPTPERHYDVLHMKIDKWLPVNRDFWKCYYFSSFRNFRQ